MTIVLNSNSLLNSPSFKMVRSKDILVKVSKWLLHIICLSLFLAYAVSIMKKYFEDYTATLVDIINEDNLELPAITICAEHPVKENRSPMTSEDFLKITYDLKELVIQINETDIEVFI